MRLQHQAVLPNAPVIAQIKPVASLLVVRHAELVGVVASVRQTATALVIARDTVICSAVIAVAVDSPPKRRVSRHVLEAKSLD